MAGPNYAEEIRRMVVARYGDEAVRYGGLRLDTAMQPKLQAAADESLKVGLEALDRRMGYRGPLGSVDEARFSVLRPLIARRIAESGRRETEEVLVADLTRLVESKPALALPAEDDRSEADPNCLGGGE